MIMEGLFIQNIHINNVVCNVNIIIYTVILPKTNFQFYMSVCLS